MIGIGPDTNEVLELLFARKDISMITGNHDEVVLALIKEEEYPESHSHVKEHHRWIAERMDQSFIHKLEQLPRIIDRNIEGHPVLFTHYYIENSKIKKHISKDPFHSIVDPSLNNLEKLFHDRKEKLICFGHHHPIQYFEGNHGKKYLNPGSLGCNDKPAAPYAIVDITYHSIEISLKEATYDNSQFLASYERLQVPDRELILKVFHRNQIKTRI